MKKRSIISLKTVFIFSFLLLAVFSLTSSAYATNGYFAHGYSIKNKALAGAGAALPLDSFAASTNPGGMVFVGNRIDIGISFFNPNREYTARGGTIPPPEGCPGAPGCPFTLTPGTVESDSKWFIIPALGINRMMNNNYSLGLSIFGNGGMNTDYDESTFYGSSPTGVDLSQLFIMPTYARKLNPVLKFSVLSAESSPKRQGLI